MQTVSNKPPKSSIKTLIRRAYKNRYGFDNVKIEQDGKITGKYNGLPGCTNLGHIADCYTSRSEACNVRLYNRHVLVYTFPWDV